MINIRKEMEEIIIKNSAEIDKLLNDKMKDGPPEEKPEDVFKKKLEKQSIFEMPECLEDAIMQTPITAVVDFDQKTKRPIYLECTIGEISV
jgi:hypothetical protein